MHFNTRRRRGRGLRAAAVPAAGLALLLLGPAAGAQAADPGRGRALYDNHCQQCHESRVHLREKRKVGTRAELRRRVAGWAEHAALGWRREDVDDVTCYLERAFYDFGDTSGGTDSGC